MTDYPGLLLYFNKIFNIKFPLTLKNGSFIIHYNLREKSSFQIARNLFQKLRKPPQFRKLSILKVNP